MGKLVIVEGIMGSGKSTLSTDIALRLQALKRPYLLYWENQGDHPTKDSKPREHTTADLMERSLEKWLKFSHWLQAADCTCVYDGRLFHGHAGILFMRGTPLEQIHQQINRIEQIMAPLAPALIYLYQQDVRAGIMRTAQKRGERFVNDQLRKLELPYATERNLQGLEGLIALYTNYRSMTDSLYRNLSLRKVSIDTLGEVWEDYATQVWSFLGVPNTPLKRDANRHLVKQVDITPAKLTIYNHRPHAVAIKKMPYRSARIEPIAEVGSLGECAIEGMLAERYRAYDDQGQPIQDAILDGSSTTLEIL